jgi:hypothetical protein
MNEDLMEYDFSRGKRGPAISTKGKTRITIYLDDAILERRGRSNNCFAFTQSPCRAASLPRNAVARLGVMDIRSRLGSTSGG